MFLEAMFKRVLITLQVLKVLIPNNVIKLENNQYYIYAGIYTKSLISALKMIFSVSAIFLYLCRIIGDICISFVTVCHLLVSGVRLSDLRIL